MYETLTSLFKDKDKLQLQLPGLLKGRDYVPHVYVKLQRASIDHYFKTNGQIEYSRIKKVQVCT